jgi:cytochrome c5
MLKPFLLLAAVVLIVLSPGFASVGAAQQSGARHTAKSAASSPSPAAAAADAQAKGLAQAKKLYGIDCALCHGATGDGKTDVAKDMSLTLADWTDPKSLAGKTDQELTDIIRKGKDKMPPEDKSRATDEEVKNLIVYIRSMSKAPGATPAAAAPASPDAAAPAPDPSH